jgi:hypothetical protein
MAKGADATGIASGFAASAILRQYRHRKRRSDLIA